MYAPVDRGMDVINVREIRLKKKNVVVGKNKENVCGLNPE